MLVRAITRNVVGKVMRIVTMTDLILVSRNVLSFKVELRLGLWLIGAEFCTVILSARLLPMTARGRG